MKEKRTALGSRCPPFSFLVPVVSYGYVVNKAEWVLGREWDIPLLHTRMTAPQLLCMLIFDHREILGNCSPSFPLTQHFALLKIEKLVLT